MFKFSKKKESKFALALKIEPIDDQAKKEDSTIDEVEFPPIAEGKLIVRVAEIVGLKLNTAESLPYVLIEVDKNEVLIKSSSLDSKAIHLLQRATFDVSKAAPIDVSVNIPNRNEDINVGSIRVNPSYIDQKPYDLWLQLSSNSSESENVVVRVQMIYKKNEANKRMSIEDFDLLKVIGKGSFGKVMQVRKKDSNRIYAMKILKKAHIVERDEVSHTLAERMVLAKIQHPFIVNLKYSFQSPEKLYLALAFVNGGELFFHLQTDGRFSEPRAKFYTAELLSALECLHSFNIIYRDLKPENILLDYAGHIALCDFGLCKLNMNDGKKTNTFCGTPEYLAPEVLIGKGYTKAVDWWTLGILLFEMITGLPPFYDENVNSMYKKILSDPLVFPNGVSPVAEDILRKLLDRNPVTRLGANGPQDIKSHPFFQDVDWRRLLAKKYNPPFRPNVKNAQDTSNFDDEFTNEIPVDSVADTSHLSEAVQQQFQGFSYQAHDLSSSLVGSLATRMGTLGISHRPGNLDSVQELENPK